MQAEQFELPEPSQEVEDDLVRVRGGTITPADPKYVRFFHSSKRNREKSKHEGRPIFEPVECIEILTVGDKDNIAVRKIREIDKYIWREKYVQFRRGKAQEAEGTPLDAIGISPERVSELAHFRIKTVDQLAEVPDSAVPGLGMNARKEREKARGYLALMKDSAPIAEMKAANESMAKENEAMKSRLEALEKLAAQTTENSKPQMARK